MLDQNLRNDCDPPKFKKRPCPTEKSQFFIFICSLRFLWIFHAFGSIKIGEKLCVWFFQSPGPLKFANQPIFIFICFLRFHLKTTWSVPWKNWVPRAVYDCLLGWSCSEVPCTPICQSTNFYFHQLSKVFMTVLHQNMTNDNPPPNYDKWPCSTKI